MARRLPETLADYFVVAIVPVLIMFLIGSYTFFLAEVLYQGPYGTRLKFILAMVVMGMVAIARLSIESGRERAALFAVPLAAVTVLAINVFVGSSGLIPGLACVGIVWGAAHMLTWDCTVADEARDMSGQGLLQTAGLDRAEALDPGSRTPAEPAAGTDWWQRLADWRRRPHAHGVWVIYVSLVALPTFGFLGWQLGGRDLSQRRAAFFHLCLYVASALGLLLTTSFLSLRRYLRQRQVEMPAEMAGVWLAVGSAIIGALLLVCAVLPRPSPEYSIAHWEAFRGHTDHQPSRWGFGRDGVPRPSGQSGEPNSPQGSKGSPPSTSPPSAGQQGTPSASGESSRGESSQGTPSPGNNAQGNASGESSNDGRSESPSTSPAPSGEQTANQPSEPRSEPSSSSANAPSATEKQPNPNPPATESSASEPPAQPPAAQSTEPPRPATPPSSFSPASWLPGLMSLVGGLLQFLYYGFFLALVIWAARKYRTAILAAWRKFVADVRAWLAAWFGATVAAPAPELAEAPREPPPRPFADFPDPFRNGTAERMPAAELVRFTFAALEAWAREGACPRTEEQTPHEFAAAVGRQFPPLAADTRLLAELFALANYSRRTLPAASVRELRRLWTQMTSLRSAVPAT